MKEEEQRIAIAEACGWRMSKIALADDLGPIGKKRRPSWFHPDYSVWPEGDDMLPKDPPDYLSDLNAMHEVEKNLSFEQCGAYSLELNAKIKQDKKSPKFKVDEFRWHTTAAQRAEAFLRTIGRWKD